jgi:hypothetical protein
VAQRTISLYLFETQERQPKFMLQARFGYPSDLPNLAKLKPPKGNTRPDGVKASHYVRQQSENLPPYHESVWPKELCQEEVQADLMPCR